MTTSQTTEIDGATVARLSRGFHDTFRNLAAEDGVFRSDVFFDLNMPVWRFQLQGREAWESQLRKLAEGGGEVRVDVVRTVPTVSGFVTEHVEYQTVRGRELSARRLWLCQVRDGLISDVVGTAAANGMRSYGPDTLSRHR